MSQRKGHEVLGSESRRRFVYVMVKTEMKVLISGRLAAQHTTRIAHGMHWFAQGGTALTTERSTAAELGTPMESSPGVCWRSLSRLLTLWW